MKLKELYKKEFKKVQFIGVYEEDENGNPKPIYPDYADEYLETHGNMEVKDYQYSQKYDCLVVEF